jgi:hypothetical protein
MSWLNERTYAPDWTMTEREQWMADYRAGRAVLLPHAEHEVGECGHCDLLRAMMREVDDDES